MSPLLFALPFEKLKSGSLSCMLSLGEDFTSNKRPSFSLGLNVRPMYLSPPGDLGGVSICDDLGLCGVAIIFEMNIGEGGAVSVVDA